MSRLFILVLTEMHILCRILRYKCYTYIYIIKHFFIQEYNFIINNILKKDYATLMKPNLSPRVVSGCFEKTSVTHRKKSR